MGVVVFAKVQGLKVSRSRNKIVEPKLLPKNEPRISALEVYCFKVNTKRESMFFLQEDRLFCTNLEVVNFQGRNPMFVFLEKLWLDNFVSRLIDL